MTDVVDGDTVDVRQGDQTDRVRIIGIDTPERGECGYEQAADVLAGHVLGQDVVLVPGARDDRDSYERVLRYVDRASDGLDSGRSLLDAGLAVARYDSRDGYGAHPREPGYVAAEPRPRTPPCARRRPRRPPAPAPAPAPAPVAPAPLVDTRAGCDPAYPRCACRRPPTSTAARSASGTSRCCRPTRTASTGATATGSAASPAEQRVGLSRGSGSTGARAVTHDRAERSARPCRGGAAHRAPPRVISWRSAAP